jgi:maltose alpha-D-glucosyltransferase / alpha-amylase
VRTPMQWSAEKNAGFSEAEETYLPVIDDPVYGYRRVNVAVQEEEAGSLLWATRYLLAARKRHPALQHGRFELLPTESAAVLAYWRTLDEERILCLYNLGPQPQSLSLDLSAWQGCQLVDLLSEAWSETVTGWPVVKLLAPYAAHWLRLTP